MADKTRRKWIPGGKELGTDAIVQVEKKSWWDGSAEEVIESGLYGKRQMIQGYPVKQTEKCDTRLAVSHFMKRD